MIKDALQWVLDKAGKVERFEVDGRPLFSEELFNAPRERNDPKASAVQLHSLLGLVQFLASGQKNLSLVGHTLHVADPNKIQLIGPIRELERDREIPVICTSQPTATKYLDEWLSLELGIIALMSVFEKTEARDELITKLSEVSAVKETKMTDEGSHQNITVTSKTDMKSNTKIVNPVILRPYLTFPELEQPDVPFLVRLKETQHGMSVIFKPCDGGKWEVATIKRLHDHLLELGKGEHLPETYSLPDNFKLPPVLC